MQPWERLTELTRQQYGIVSTRQAEDAGLPGRTLRSTAARQGWERSHRGVYAPVGAFDTPEGRLAAAVLAVGPPVLVAGWSAAWLHGLVPVPPTKPELVVPHQRRTTALPGIVVRRSRTLVVADGFAYRNLPVTTAVRTICDLAAVTGEEALRSLLIDARQRRLLDLAELAERLSTLGTAKGTRQARRLVAELDRVHCDSVLERKLRDKLAGVPGLPAPAPHPVAVDVGHGRVLHVDIAWPTQRVGIEVDGFGSHSDRKSLEVDVMRHNALARVRWQAYRASWPQLGAGFPQLVADVLDALSGR